jgi:hypothetical protein
MMIAGMILFVGAGLLSTDIDDSIVEGADCAARMCMLAPLSACRMECIPALWRDAH